MSLIAESEQIILRHWTTDESDLTHAHEILDDSTVIDFLPTNEPSKDENKVKSVIEGFLKHQQEYGVHQWAIELRSSGEVIGFCGFKLFRDSRSVYELEVSVKQRYSKKGYDKEAAQLALNSLFELKTVTKIISSTPPKNKATKQLLEVLGFTLKDMKFSSASKRIEAFYELKPNLSNLPKNVPPPEMAKPEIAEIQQPAEVKPLVTETEVSIVETVSIPHVDAVVVFFDGVCGLCNGFVDFLIKHNSKGLIKFAALQSSAAQRLLDKKYTEDLETLVILVNGKVYTRSTDALISLKYIDGIWGALTLLLIIPRPLRNIFYNLIAKLRYTIFGKRETCRLPNSEEKKYFLN